MGCHEWFGPDGRYYWCDYNDGIYRTDTGPNRKRELIWPRPSWHGQTDPATGKFHCADIRPYTWDPCQVYYFDEERNRDIAIASDLPRPDVGERNWRKWHLDPHPHFSDDGAYVIYTTTAIDGNLSVALSPTAGLKKQIAELPG